MVRLTKLSADPGRVAADLDALAAIGRVGETGVCRLAFTAEDLEARAYVIHRMRHAGLQVSVDAFGNIFGRRQGLLDGLGAVMFGSHIDTTTLGGQFDGTVGVVGALEVMRLVTDHDLAFPRSLVTVVFAAEESSRFGVALLGSRATAGRITPEDLRRLQDREGVTLWQALERAGLLPAEVGSCVMPKGAVRAYLELHIEQSRVLESGGHRIGVVTGIAAPTRGIVTVHGQADHSGGTPMAMRRDALTAAAEAILQLERLAQDESLPGTVATVGTIDVRPGALNTIPGEVRFGVDIRSIDTMCKRRTGESFRASLTRIARARRVSIDFVITADDDPSHLAPSVIATIGEACRAVGVEPHYMVSGATHDAQEVAKFAEAGMIFVPSRAGISHAPEEYTSIEEICLGIEVLAESVRRLALEDKECE